MYIESIKCIVCMNAKVKSPYFLSRRLVHLFETAHTRERI